MSTIVFDGICLADGPITGVGRAFLNGLAAYAEGFTNDCVLLLPPAAAAPTLPGVRVVDAPRGRVRRQLQLPRLLRALRADVLHSSVAAVPLRAPCATLATVHDLPWLRPEAEEATTRWRRLATTRSLRAASGILAPSTMTRSDAAAVLGDHDTPIFLVPHGCELGPEPVAAGIDARSGPLLVLGDDRPRKNHERVQEAHALARSRCPGLPDVHFVGPPNAYVDEAEKLELLRSCRGLVHVSLFEGFGMPVLEALANGAPVLCSELPPLREIAGGHALFVDPRSADAIAAGMCRLHEDSALRLELATNGYQRARGLQPRNTAEQWHDVHQQVTS